MGIALITKDYENTVGKQRMPVIVEFYASWCPKCGMMYPVVERIASRYQGKWIFYKIDIDISKEIAEYIDLGLIKPYYQFNSIVADTTRTILQGPKSDKLFEFSFTLGTTYHKQVAQKWLTNFQITVAMEDIILTSGTQNALAIALLSLFRSGDKIATDSYTYSNFITLAKQLNVQQTADDGTGITAYNTYEEIHTTSFSFTAHNAVGNIANENTSKDWPRCEICNMF